MALVCTAVGLYSVLQLLKEFFIVPRLNIPYYYQTPEILNPKDYGA